MLALAERYKRSIVHHALLDAEHFERVTKRDVKIFGDREDRKPKDWCCLSRGNSGGEALAMVEARWPELVEAVRAERASWGATEAERDAHYADAMYHVQTKYLDMEGAALRQIVEADGRRKLGPDGTWIEVPGAVGKPEDPVLVELRAALGAARESSEAVCDAARSYGETLERHIAKLRTPLPEDWTAGAG